MTRMERKKRVDTFMTLLFYGGAGFAVLLLAAFIGLVLAQGFSGFTLDMISFDGGGLGNLFFNTIYLVFLALVISAAIGIPAGIYLAEYARQGRLTRWVRMILMQMMLVKVMTMEIILLYVQVGMISP